MFCPNCGKDCGDARFCTNCGKNLQQSNAIQATDTNAPAGVHGQFAPPVGVYNGLWCSLEITYNTVIITHSDPMLLTSRCVVPYHDIRFVTHMPQSETRDWGFLSIYTWQKSGPLIASSYEAERDSLSVLCKWKDEISFMLFRFLSECASMNRTNRLKMKEKALPPDVLKLAQSKYALKHYRQYYPNKQEAICAMKTDTGLSEAEATPVINYVFDVFNNEIYEKFEDSLGLPYKVKCPSCSSHRIASKERGFDHYRSTSMLAVSPALGMYLGSKDADKEQYVCMKCGYIWYQK